MYTSSPSHHRELSHAEKNRVQGIVDAVESTILGCTPSDQNATSGVLAQQLTDLPQRLGELLAVVQLDESVCGGLVKTTRTVPILRRLLDLHLEYVVAAETSAKSAAWGAEQSAGSVAYGSGREAADAIYCALPVAARILLVLVVNSHSRRAFSGILPAHAAGFLQLLRHADTLPDCSRMLCHVFQYTQDAKDILDQLVDKAGFLQVLQHVCRDAVVRSAAHSATSIPAVEVSLMTAIFSLMSAVIGVTPRPDSKVLEAVLAMMTGAMLPLLLEREVVWASDMAELGRHRHHQQSTTPESPALRTEMLERITALNGEVLQVVSVLALEGYPLASAASPSNGMSELLHCWDNTETTPQEEVVSFWRSCCCVGAPLPSTTASCSSSSDENDPHGARTGGGGSGGSSSHNAAADVMMTMVVRRMREHLSTIRRHNLNTKAVQAALVRMHEDVGGVASTSAAAASTTGNGGISGNAARAIAETCSFVVGHLPGGMKTLCGTLSTVDEDVSSLSCAVLVTLLRGAAASSLLSTVPSISTAECDGTVAAAAADLLAEQSRNPIHQFVALDGILLLADMLDDYSDDVLAGAVGLLAAASASPRAVREMVSHHVLRKVRTLMTTVAERMWADVNGGGDRGGGTDGGANYDGSATSGLADNASSSSSSSSPVASSSSQQGLTPLAVLCCDLVSRLPDDGLVALSAAQHQQHLASVLCLWWRYLDWRIVAAEQQPAQQSHDCSAVDVFPVLNPFLRMCCRIAALHGDTVRASLSLYHHCTTATGASNAAVAPNIPWMSVWVRAALQRGGVDAGIAVASSVTQLVIPYLLSFDVLLPSGDSPTQASGEDVVRVVCDVARGVFSIPVDCVVKQRRLFATFWSATADLLDRCVLLPQIPQLREDQAPARESQRVLGEGIVHACQSNLWESLIGSLHAVSNVSDVSAGGVGDALIPIVRILKYFRMLQQDDIVNAIASVAARGDCSFEDRVTATHILMHHILRNRIGDDGGGAGGAPAELRHAVTTTLSREVRDSLALLWTRIILLCEEGGDADSNNNNNGFSEAVTSLANECFAELVEGAEHYVAVLIRTGSVVLDFMMAQPPPSAPSADSTTAASVPLGWLGYATDADDAHDILVAVVPLINGLLSQCPPCRWTVVRGDLDDNIDSSLLVFFLRLLSCGAHLEVPLKVLGMYGLWHCLDLSLCPDSQAGQKEGTTASASALHYEAAIAVRLRQHNVFPILAHVLREAHDGNAHQPEDALTQIRLGCYLLAERVVILSPTPTVPGALPWSDVQQFIEHTIFVLGGESEPQACSMLLCVLQDDHTRHYFRTNCSGAYGHVLQRLRNALHVALSGGGAVVSPLSQGGSAQAFLPPPPPPPSSSLSTTTSGGGDYYAFLQVQKYYAELLAASPQ